MQPPKKNRAALHSRLGDLFQDLQPVEPDARPRPSPAVDEAPAPDSAAQTLTQGAQEAALAQVKSPAAPGEESLAGAVPWTVGVAAFSPAPAAGDEPDIWLPEAAAPVELPAAVPGEGVPPDSQDRQALGASLLVGAQALQDAPARDEDKRGAGDTQVAAETQAAIEPQEAIELQAAIEPQEADELQTGLDAGTLVATAVATAALEDRDAQHAMPGAAHGRHSLRGKAWGDFVLLGGVTLLLAVLIVLSSGLLAIPAPPLYLSPLRVALGVFYLLFVPGYFLTAAIFPQKEDLDGLERVGLSLGLSVVILPLQALLLNQLPAGLTFQSMVAMSLGSGLLLLLAAFVQRWRLPAQVVAESFGPLSPRRWWGGLSRSDRLSYLVVIPILLFTAVAAAWAVTASSAKGGGVTTSEFYILGEEGLAQDYPRQGRVGQPLSVTFGIHNQEGQQELYRVEARNGADLVGVAGPFTLQDDETLTAPLNFTPVQAGENQRIDILLYRGNSQEAYRRLALWLVVGERQEGGE